MSEKLRENIIKTLAFFDLLDMPLTKEGVFEYLYWPDHSVVSAESVNTGLQNLIDSGVLSKKGDLFYLSDRDETIIETKRQSYKRTLGLLKGARPWLSFMAGWPGVESIAICNNLAFYNAGENSDIDLFIITKPNQIWQTRFALAAFLQIFKKRPLPGKEYGKICISFFVTSDNLDLSSIAIENDIYLRYWLRSLMPLYDPENLMQDIRRANQSLYQDVARTMHPPKDSFCPIRIDQKLYSLSAFSTKPADWFSAGLEKRTKAWQQKRFPASIQEAAQSDGTEVIINDQMLKFHTTDNRQDYRDRWIKRYGGFL